MRPLALLTLLLACGCGRTFAPAGSASAAAQTLGNHCGGDGECQSGHCVDGLCCEQLCGAGQSCADARSPGRCRTLTLGDACSAASQCPGGFCVDGVCCDIACTGSCEACDLPGFEGQCHGAADGTDPRRACGGPCAACHEGACGPALIGSDPHGSCAPGVCSLDQSCKVALGGSCSADADCAEGSCLLQSCLAVEQTAVLVSPMQSDASSRMVTGLAGNAQGVLAMVFTEFSGSPSPPFSERDLFVVLRSEQGTFSAIDVYSDRYADLGGLESVRPIAAGIVALPSGAFYVASYPGEAEDTTCVDEARRPCGLHARTILPDGTVSAFERIASDPTLFNVRDLQLAASRDGTVVLAYSAQLDPSGTSVVGVATRQGTDWTAPAPSATGPLYLPHPALTSTGAYVVGYTAGAAGDGVLALMRADGSEVAVLDGPTDYHCPWSFNHLGIVADEDSPIIRVEVGCGFDVTSPEIARLQLDTSRSPAAVPYLAVSHAAFSSDPLPAGAEASSLEILEGLAADSDGNGALRLVTDQPSRVIYDTVGEQYIARWGVARAGSEVGVALSFRTSAPDRQFDASAPLELVRLHR